jgi:hypothetical protein
VSVVHPNLGHPLRGLARTQVHRRGICVNDQGRQRPSITVLFQDGRNIPHARVQRAEEVRRTRVQLELGGWEDVGTDLGFEAMD